MIINNNITALNTYNQLNKNNKRLSNMIEKLSSGLAINQAADDAAGLAISEKMRAQIRGLDQAQRNIQDGISLIQTVEGGLGSIADQLQRARELFVQAANDTLTNQDRVAIQQEVEQIKNGINHIANHTEFNGKDSLNQSIEMVKEYQVNKTPMSFEDAKAYANSQGGYLVSITSAEEQATVQNVVSASGSGTLWIGLTNQAGNWTWESGEPLGYSNWNPNEPSGSGGRAHFYSNGKWNDVHGGYSVHSIIEFDKEIRPELDLQIGANTEQSLTIELTDARTTALGINDIDLTTRTGAMTGITQLDQAIQQVSSERGKFGSYQNRLEHTLHNVTNYEVNLSAAESRIRDTDMAKEMMVFTKQTILTQASESMLSQANQIPQRILSLLN